MQRYASVPKKSETRIECDIVAKTSTRVQMTSAPLIDCATTKATARMLPQKRSGLLSRNLSVQ